MWYSDIWKTREIMQNQVRWNWDEVSLNGVELRGQEACTFLDLTC